MKKKLLANLFLAAGILAAGIIVILAGFEIYLRRAETHIVREFSAGKNPLVESDAEFLVRYTSRGRRLVPNSRVIIRNHRISGRDVTMEVNSLGFRDGELPAVKSAEELRILVLGDSITWASYLPAEETWVERAEKYLGEALPERTVEIVNAGVGDIGLTEEIAILQERGLSLSPDVVVVSFYLNDSRPPWGFPGEIGRRGWLRRHSLLAETIYKNLKLRRWISEHGEDRLIWTEAMNRVNWKGDRAIFLELASLAQYDWGAAWQTASWKVIDRELGRLKELSQEHGFAVAIVAFPVAFQVYADFVEDAPQKLLGEKAADLGFAYLDLLPLLRQYRTREKDVYFDWCHPTAKTNDMIGKTVAAFLRKIIDRLPPITVMDEDTSM